VTLPERSPLLPGKSNGKLLVILKPAGIGILLMRNKKRHEQNGHRQGRLDSDRRRQPFNGCCCLAELDYTNPAGPQRIKITTCGTYASYGFGSSRMVQLFASSLVHQSAQAAIRGRRFSSRSERA
jgi:hypothetical protein